MSENLSMSRHVVIAIEKSWDKSWDSRSQALGAISQAWDKSWDVR